MCNCSSGTCNCTSSSTPITNFSPQNYTPQGQYPNMVTGQLAGIDAELGTIEAELAATNFTSPNSTITIGAHETLQATFDVRQYSEVALDPTDAIFTETTGKALKYKRNANKQIVFEGAVYISGSLPAPAQWVTITQILTANDRPIQPIYLVTSGYSNDVNFTPTDYTQRCRITINGLVQIYVDANTEQNIVYTLDFPAYNTAG